MMTDFEKRLHDDFPFFLAAAWSFLNLPAPTKRQLAIARFLQKSPNRRRCVLAFRGAAKSWITAAYCLWRLYRNQQENILVVSASGARARGFTTFCLQLLSECPFLQHLRPRPDQRSSREEFDVNGAEPDQNPSVRSVGITGSMTGFRATIIVPDDVEVPKNAATPVQREKLAESVKEFESILMPGGEIDYLGTLQIDQSLYTTLEERGYTVRIWPIRYPEEGLRKDYGYKLAPDILAEMEGHQHLIGTSTEPTRFTDEDIAARELFYGKHGFALQFMLNPSVSEAKHPLKIRDLIVTHVSSTEAPERLVWNNDPDNILRDLPADVLERRDYFYGPAKLPVKVNYEKYERKVMLVDPSGRGSDETAYAVCGSLHSMIYLLDVGGFMKGYDPSTLEALAKVAFVHGVQQIYVEDNFGDGMFTALLKPYIHEAQRAGVEDVKHSVVSKERRIIDTLEPVVSTHRLVINQGLVEKDYNSVNEYEEDVTTFYRLFYQFTHLTAEKGSLTHDDRLDAVAGAVAQLQGMLGLSPEEAVERSQARRLEKELENHMRTSIWPSSDKPPAELNFAGRYR